MEEDLGTLVRVWTDGSFVMRSGFYAGRPPSSGDLGSQHLELFYEGIKKDVGQDAASNFVRFVNNLDDLCASSFIVAFERFWYSDCELVKAEQSTSDSVRLSARGEALQSEGMGAIAMMLGNKLDEPEYRHRSEEVKADFIIKHIDEIPKEERREITRGFRFF